MKTRLMRNINIIARCATLYRDEHLAACGLNGCQAPYLPEICTNPGITQDQLAQKLHVNRSSVTRQLTLLEEGGFIKRVRSDSDRRAIELFPTERAESALPIVHEAYRSWREELTQGLKPEELKILEELLDHLARQAEEIR